MSRNICFALIVLLAATEESSAQMYKCKYASGNTYSDEPCPPGRLVKVIDVTQQRTAAQERNSIEQQLLVAKDKMKLRKIEAIKMEQVVTGMTASEVVRSWGQPTKINRTVIAGKVSEQWIYRRGGIGNDQYLYIDNNVLRSIQTSIAN